MRTRIDDEREAPDVAAWRCGRLVAAGFTFRDAARLATDPRYDVHELAGLVARMILLPIGALQETTLLARLAATALAAGVFFATRRNLLLGVASGSILLALLSV